MGREDFMLGDKFLRTDALVPSANDDKCLVTTTASTIDVTVRGK